MTDWPILFSTARDLSRWFCFTFDNGLRRLVQNPDRIIRRCREGTRCWMWGRASGI